VLQDYRRVLSMPRTSLRQAGADGVIVSAVLMSISAVAFLAFDTSRASHDDASPTDSWVFCPTQEEREERTRWVALYVGFTPMLRSMMVYLPKSVRLLGDIFFGDVNEMVRSIALSHKLEPIPDTWLAVFGIKSETGSQARRLFARPLRALAHARRLPPTRRNIIKVFQFLTKMRPELLALLASREEQALWLFGYWLGIMCRFEGQWWWNKSIKTDYLAIQLWLDRLQLDTRPGEEGQNWSEMMKELKSAPGGPNHPG
jgi:hypothetical protein